MRRPNKPHRDGYEDEEDCEGYYDPDEADRRGCWACMGGHHGGGYGQACYEAWRAKEADKRKAEWDAKTQDERAAGETLDQFERRKHAT